MYKRQSDGSAVYFDKADLKRDDFGILKASSGIPVVCRPCRWEGRVYFDGGIADPVPVERALADGCDRVVVVLTKPRDHVRSFARDRTLYCLMKPRFPRAAEALRQRAGRYNGAVERVKRLEREGRALIVAPEGVDADTLSRDRQVLEGLYDQGYRLAARIPAFVRREVPAI